jgi:hypothetical protein
MDVTEMREWSSTGRRRAWMWKARRRLTDDVRHDAGFTVAAIGRTRP